jgi:hypothetical protein
MSIWSGIGYSRAAMALRRVLLPQPFSPSKPYRLPMVSSRVESVIRTRPWNTKLALVILTSLLAYVEARTPVVTRSERPWRSICSVRRLTSSIFSGAVAGPSESSPLTDAAALVVFELALDREATVFLPSAAAAARLARRFSFDAEGGMLIRYRSKRMSSV